MRPVCKVVKRPLLELLWLLRPLKSVARLTISGWALVLEGSNCWGCRGMLINFI